MITWQIITPSKIQFILMDGLIKVRISKLPTQKDEFIITLNGHLHDEIYHDIHYTKQQASELVKFYLHQGLLELNSLAD